MQTEYIKAGSTDVRIPVRILDSSTLQATDNTAGRGLTGLVFNSSGLTCYYFREDGGNNASVQISLVTYTRGGTHADGGFAEQDATNSPGGYWLCLPDAVVASGAGWAMVLLKGAANMIQTAIKIIIIEDKAVVAGVVGSSSSTTSIVTSSLSPAAVDTNQFRNRVVIFSRDTTTAGLRCQGSQISASTTGGVLTVNALTTVPVSGDTFEIF